MNHKEREQAIRSFVKDKFEFLLSKSFAQQKLRHEFHRRHGNKFGKLEPKDIVVPLVNLLKDTHVSPQNIKQYLETLPVFRNINSGLLLQLRQIAYEKDFSSGLKDEDLELIRKLDAIEAATALGAVKAGIEQNKTLEELNKKIQLAQSEYDSFPTVLDYEEVSEPEFDPDTEAVKQWWERFYLKENPFPQKDGLSQIDESLYEAVLVKTRPFRECLGSLKANQNHLFDAAFLLCGDSGYGKTTFIDYLSYYLIQIDILPVRITCDRGYVDSAGFLTAFDLQLREKLRTEFQIMSEEKIDRLAELSPHAQIQKLIELIANKSKIGVVVFLDDYHKYPSEFPQICEFLGQLQVLKNNLTRAKLRAGFVVSGTAAWNKRLLQDGHLRGFLDGTAIEMPEITPQLVCDVFNQRISAYCYEESSRKIKPEFVELIFKQMDGTAGYREYLNRIITELKKNNLSIIDTPIEIETDILSKIKAVIESDAALRDSFNKLIYGAKFKRYTAEQTAKCLELLIQTSIHEGVNEIDRLFDENKYYFNFLRECGLIQKRRRSASDSVDTFDWVIHSRLQKAAEAVREKFRLTINDYLLKIYAKRDYALLAAATPKQESELAEVIRFFERTDLNRIPQLALDKIRTALRVFDGILMAGDGKRPTDQHVNRGWDAFALLSEGFFEIDESRKLFNDAGISDVSERWYLHLFDDEMLLELLNRYEEFTRHPEDRARNASLVDKQLREVFPSLAEHLKIITEDLSDKTFFGLSCHLIHHNKAELNLFERVRDGYFSAVGSSHYDYIRVVTDYLELKLRKFFYAATSLIFGEKYQEQIPRALNRYAASNIDSRASFSTTENIFAGLTRGQLREIFDSGNSIKKFVCNFLNTGWISADWRTFLGEFVVANINSSHQQQDAYSPLNKELYLNYCRRAEELISSMNNLIRMTLRSHAYLIYGGGDRTQSENYLFKYSFQPIKTKSEGGPSRVLDELPDFLSNSLIADNLLSEDVYRKVMNALLYRVQCARRNSLVEDLLEIEYISNCYSVSYQDFVHSLAFAYFVDKKIVIQPWFGSSVIIKEAAK
jgi:hypothetical protein